MLENVFNDVLKLPHITNGTTRKHERKIQELLENHKFKQTTLDTFGLTKAEAKDGIPAPFGTPMTFVPEPAGSQNYPDFIICDHNGKVYFVECKSSNGDGIVWNSGTPKADGIYIVSSGKHNGQSIVKGSQFIDEGTPLMDEWRRKSKQLQKEFQELFKSIETDWDPYFRAMNNYKAKIYAHPKRQERINEVFKMVR